MTWFFIYTSDIETPFSDILCLITTNACKDMRKRLIVNSNQKNSVFEILLMKHFVKLLDHWLSKKRCISATKRSKILNFRMSSNDWLYIYVYWSINLLEIVLSDELIMLQESYEDTLNDWRMFKLTNIEQRIRQIFRDHDLLYLYDDSAYRTTYETLRSWRRHSSLNKKQRNFNKCMSKVRISVEQNFELTQKQWSHNSWSMTRLTVE
jgi:hypothetical protein